MKDLIIIGAGAAGLAASIYAARAGLDFAVLEQDGYGGGQITSSHEVENYPGVPKVSGADLGDAFRNQAEELGAEISFGIVEKVEDAGDHKVVILDGDAPMEARAVIVATGATPRILGVPGEMDYVGAGVSYCAICDGSFYAKKKVAVVGGGDTAIEDALYLSTICEKVTILLRRDRFRGASSRAALLAKRDNIEILYNTRVTEIPGDGKMITGLRIETEGASRQLDVQGVFIAVGVTPASACLDELELERADGYIVAGETCATNIPGLYVAGDLRKKPLRQVVTAVADGANAVTHAVEWLRDC